MGSGVEIMGEVRKLKERLMPTKKDSRQFRPPHTEGGDAHHAIITLVAASAWMRS